MRMDKLQKEVEDLRNELELIRREANGEGGASLASDFGGCGYETRPTNLAVRAAVKRAFDGKDKRLTRKSILKSIDYLFEALHYAGEDVDEIQAQFHKAHLSRNR